MKFETSVKDLSTALKKVIPFIGAEKTYENILLDIKNNVLTIKTYGSSANAKIRINVKSDSDFNFVIKGNEFSNIANSFKEFINIEKLDDNFILLTEKRTKIKLNILNASCFPEKLPDVEHQNGIELDSSDLIEGLEKSCNFVKSETLQGIGGINLDFKENMLIFAATDGNRISVCDFDIENTNIQNVILPLKIAKELVKYDYPNVTIYVCDRFIKFVYDDFEIISSLVNDTFPKYRQILELYIKNCKTKLKFKKNEIIEVIKKVELLNTDKKVTSMLITAKDNKMCIEYTNSKNNSLKEDFECEIDSECTFKCTYSYFLDCIRNFKGDISMKLGSETDYVMLFENGNNTMLLMAVK